MAVLASLGKSLPSFVNKTPIPFLQFDLSSEYGPLNNITYEERLYRSYFLGKFSVKEGKNEEANLR